MSDLNDRSLDFYRDMEKDSIQTEVCNLFKRQEYRLRLGDGRMVWRIIGNKGLKPWIEKLVRIMELKEWDDRSQENVNERRLIFIPSDSFDKENESLFERIDQELKESLPLTGWESRNLHEITLWFHEDMKDVICEIQDEMDDDLTIISMTKICYPIQQGLLEIGGFPFHAALVEKNGKGIVLAASGGTGKSTCARRVPLSWKALCDDLTLILQNNGGKYEAHPFPTWTDYLWRRSEGTWNVETHVPLIGIFFLRQAETDEVIPLGQGEASIYINQSATEICRAYWWKMDHEKIRSLRIELFNNACEVAKTIPAFILNFSLNGQFWKEIEKVLE